MSKKRKTRKQKEIAHLRHIDQIQHIQVEAPTYTVPDLKTKEIKKVETKKTPIETSVAQKDIEYLRHDMVAITAAAGIVGAFDILLFVLLLTRTIHLNFLGY